MSIHVMNMVWSNALNLEGRALLVLLALADWAGDDGVCWPSIPTLARRARVSERTAQYLVRQLVDLGYLSIEEGGGRHHSNLYTLNLDNISSPAEKSPHHPAAMVQPLHPLPASPLETPQPLHPLSPNPTQSVQRLHPLSPNSPETPQSLHPLSSKPSQTVQSVHPLPPIPAPQPPTPSQTVQSLHPSTPETVQSQTERVQFPAQKGAIAIAPDPSIDPLKDPYISNGPPPAKRFPLPSSPTTLPTSQYLAMLITDFSNELGDTTHIRENVNQTLRLWSRTTLSQEAFGELCQIARARTRKQQSRPYNALMRNKMAYFFAVLRDLAANPPAPTNE